MDNNQEYKGLIKLFSILWPKRKQFLIFNGLIFLFSIIVSILLPQWYKGSITIIVNDESKTSMLNNIVGNLPLDILGGTSSKIEQYMNFVYSRSILDSLDVRYNLFDEYGNDYRKLFYKQLKSNIIIIDNNDETFTVDFYYEEDPAKAAAIANSIFNLLNDLSEKLNRARSTRLKNFLQESYDLTIKRLHKLEKQMTDFQVSNQIYEAETQLKLLIEKIAELEIDKIQTEIELQYLKENLYNDNSRVNAFKTKVGVIKKKIDELKFGNNATEISLNEMPEKVVKYLNLYRDVTILNTVLEFLVPQLEQAKLQEIKKGSDLQLLEIAVPEDYKSKPKRLAIIFTITFLSLIFSILYFIMIDRFRKEKLFLNEIFNKS